ncbi:uncharacterized protein F54H12.2-like [Watersipora subatra]|uniref:uncharacterized protein F54H12.2-like n=1 Tax=Watersipora subatra TaxID=2589382 RepID=UPI00355C4DB2
MSYTFENSCLASNSELELFSNHPTQACIEEGMHVEHIPTSSVQDDSPIKFFVSGDSNYYMDLKSSYLHLEIKITKADGSNIDDDAEVAPINLIGQTLFQQIDVSLNDVIITDSSNLYHYRAMIETLLSYSDESKQSQLTMSMFAKDTANAMEARNDSNKGFVERKRLTEKSKTVQLIGKIHSDIFFQNRYLLNGVDLKLTLIKNSDKLILMSGGASGFKLKIINASFFVRKVKINDGIQMKHIEMLEKELKPALYPIRRVTMKSFNIPSGSLSCNEENLFNGILPKRIFIGMVDARSFEGNFEYNPFNFKHKNLKYCSLLVDGKMVPQKPFFTDFSNDQFLRSYFSLIEGTGKAFKDVGIGIDRTEYAHGYSLLAFDLTPSLDDDGSFNVLKKGNIRFEAKFNSGLDVPVNVIVYAEFDATIKIDKNRAVLPNFFS